jgi:hypothetical protein
MSRGIIVVLALSFLLSACRIEITVPEGGEVITSSGAYTCEEQTDCTVQVADTGFNETFIATPSDGYQFIGWKTGFTRLCGGSLSPCPINTSWFASYDSMMDLLASDSPAFLEADFIPSEDIRTYQAGDMVVFTGTYMASDKLGASRSTAVTVRQDFLPGTRSYLDKTVLKLRTATTFADTGEKQLSEQHVWQEANGALFELTDEYGNEYVTGGAFEKGLLSIPVPLLPFSETHINFYTMYGGSVSGPITEGTRAIAVSEPELVSVPLAEYRAYPLSQRDAYEYLYTYVDHLSGSKIAIDRDIWVSPAKGAVKRVEVRRGYTRSGALESEEQWELAVSKMNF